MRGDKGRARRAGTHLQHLQRALRAVRLHLIFLVPVICPRHLLALMLRRLPVLLGRLQGLQGRGDDAAVVGAGAQHGRAAQSAGEGRVQLRVQPREDVEAVDEALAHDGGAAVLAHVHQRARRSIAKHEPAASEREQPLSPRHPPGHASAAPLHAPHCP